MGRGRGKGKKMTSSNNDDALSGEEERIPVQKRRGRPQKPVKDEIDDEDAEKIEDEEVKSPTGEENGKKRKCSSQEKAMVGAAAKEEKQNDDSVKSNGFRQNESRRKSTPRRAAEAGVACK